MTYSRFVVKNAFRNKRRTALTILSIGFSLFLLIALNTFLDTLLNPPQTEGSVLRIAVRRSTALSDRMPISYEQKIEQIPGVTLVMPLQWYGGQYKGEAKNFFPNFACDPIKLWELFPEYAASEETKKAFRETRTGAVVGEKLMKRFGWNVGDRITLQGAIFPADLDLEIVGTFNSPVRTDLLYFRVDYMDEAIGKTGQMGTFWIKADKVESVPRIIEAVDTMFKNTPAETKSETEKAFQQGFVSMLGNVRVLMGTVAMVVVFTMLLVGASTMAMTIRERIREVAILKSIGYTRKILLSLILGEAVFIALLGVVAGAAGAFIMGRFDLTPVTMGFLPRFNVKVETYITTFAVGIFIGLFSGIFPAIQASGMKITDAMRRVE
ncbi:FtsX-like permease family protein [Candidatus Sumerlaeota bacterium]|nr:FtsX-like permease family protein [Candidatus Sumerlaeota bacterium]